MDNGLLASNNFNLKPFFDRGGKLLMWHGWSDPQVPAQNSIIFFNNVLKTVGRSSASLDRAVHAAGRVALWRWPGSRYVRQDGRDLEVGRAGAEAGSDCCVSSDRWESRSHAAAVSIRSGRKVRTAPGTPTMRRTSLACRNRQSRRAANRRSGLTSAAQPRAAHSMLTLLRPARRSSGPALMPRISKAPSKAIGRRVMQASSDGSDRSFLDIEQPIRFALDRARERTQTRTVRMWSL